jgi:2-iminobutanoate/2-iminopropanoate deaminase
LRNFSEYGSISPAFRRIFSRPISQAPQRQRNRNARKVFATKFAGGEIIVIEAVATEHAPKAIGPYSQAIKANGFVYASGQVALDPRTQQLVQGDVAAETERTLENLKAVVEAAGSSLSRAVKTTVYLADMADFAKMNEVYARYFPATPPARATVQVARLPRDARVEIDLIAAL